MVIQRVINTITDIFQPKQNKNLNVISMTSKSAEIYKLAHSSFIHNKINFANFIDTKTATGRYWIKCYIDKNVELPKPIKR